MHPKSNIPGEGDARDASQRWLDFGRWLAGENLPDDCTQGDSPSPDRASPSFTRILDVHFHDIAWDALRSEGHGPLDHFPGGLEWQATRVGTRYAMHRRFIAAVHLAFGPEDLSDIAARQPAHVFHLVKHIRADFGLLRPWQIPWEDSVRFLGCPENDRMWGHAEHCQ